MPDWLHVLALLFAFYWGKYYGRRLERDKNILKMDFKWDCPNRTCSFKVMGSAEIPEDIKRNHMLTHMDE